MKIEIKGLTLNTIIGILPSEKESPQRLIIDITIDYEYTEDYIDYAKLVSFVSNFFKNNSYGLLEDAILSLKKSLYICFPLIDTLQITLTKPDILKNCLVSISL